MKFYRSFSFVAAGLLLMTSAAHAQVVATVNGVKIPQSRLDAITKGQQLTPDQLKIAKERLVRIEILNQAARRKNLQDKPEVKEAVEMATSQILANAYVSDFAAGIKITDADLKKLYNEQMSMLSDQEYKVRHILVRSEAEANDIIAQLKKGTPFAKLAQTKSLDKESGAEGGQLGWVQPGVFGNALFGITKGQYTQKPVQTPAGFHVVLVEDMRAFKKPTFDQAKEQLTQMLRVQQVNQHLEQLRNQATVQ